MTDLTDTECTFSHHRPTFHTVFFYCSPLPPTPPTSSSPLRNSGQPPTPDSDPEELWSLIENGNNIGESGGAIPKVRERKKSSVSIKKNKIAQLLQSEGANSLIAKRQIPMVTTTHSSPRGERTRKWSSTKIGAEKEQNRYRMNRDFDFSICSYNVLADAHMVTHRNQLYRGIF